MAFRGYELNLMLRVQDRASSRLRRVASDLGGVNRAANMQRDMARLTAATTRNNSVAEQNLAKQRLMGLKSANTELAIFNNQLERAVRLERLTAVEANTISKNYARAQRSGQLQKAGRTSAHVGSVGVLAGGVGLAILGSAASKFADFDVAATRASTQVGAVNQNFAMTVKQTKTLEAAIIGLSKNFPASAEEMANASYDLFSSMDLGATSAEQMRNGIKLLTVANKAAVAGQIDLGEATNTMITIFNDFDPQLQHIDRNMAQLFSTVRFMRGGFGDLGDAMNKLAPAAKQSNQTLLEVGSALAQITRAIPSQAQSGTALARLLDVFARPDFIKGMRSAGKEFDIINRSTGKLLPLHEIIGKIVALNPQLQKGGVDLNNLIKIITQRGSDTGKGGTLATINSRRALIELVTSYKPYLSILEQSTKDTKEYEKSVRLLSQTAGVQWKTSMNNLRTAWIQLGQSAMPTILGLVKGLQGLVERWQALSPHTRNAIVKFAAFASIAAVILGLVTSLVGALLILSTGFGALAAKLIPVVARLGLIEASMTALKRLGAAGIILSIVLNVSNKKKRNKIIDDAKHGLLGSAALEAVIGTDFGIGNKFGGRFWLKEEENRQKILKTQQKTFGITKLTPNKGNSAIIKQDKVIYNNKLDQIKKFNATQKNADTKLENYQKNLTKNRLSSLHSAQATQLNDIKQYTDTLVAKYKELEDAARSAYGEIFQGPISQGPIGQLYQQINNMVSGFGGKPVATPISLLTQDAKAQAQNFDILRKDYATLLKRGAPKEFVQDLQGQGMGAISQVEGLAKATPSQLNEYVKLWKNKQTAIKTAAQSDMTMTLNIWKGYGKGIAWQIVQGLASEPSQALLRTGFQKYVVSTFGQELKSGLNAQVNLAVAEWMKENPKPKGGAKTKPLPGKPVVHHTEVHHNDITHIHADGASPGAIAAAQNKAAFVKKHKGYRGRN